MEENQTPYVPLDLEEFSDVEWYRLAYPQDDMYDTEILERMCAWRYGWKLWPYERRPQVQYWLGDKIQIRPVDPYYRWMEQGLEDVKPTDLRWKWADHLINQWPAQREQFRRLINYVGSAGPVNPSHYGNGCSCTGVGGNPFFMHVPIDPDKWGNVFATMTSGSGFLEGVCHELAHWKGYVLGIYIEDWEKLIFSNDPPKREWIEGAPERDCDEETHKLWVSREIGIQPFRPDRLRPIGANFQEIWNCVHMIDLHQRIYPLMTQQGGYPGEADGDTFKDWATFHVKRTCRGQRDLIDIVRPMPNQGEAFWQGYRDWFNRLIIQAEELYQEPFDWND